MIQTKTWLESHQSKNREKEVQVSILNQNEKAPAETAERCDDAWRHMHLYESKHNLCFMNTNCSPPEAMDSPRFSPRSQLHCEAVLSHFSASSFGLPQPSLTHFRCHRLIICCLSEDVTTLVQGMPLSCPGFEGKEFLSMASPLPCTSCSVSANTETSKS